MEFEQVSEITLGRAERALKGFHKHSDGMFMAKRLSKLNGFPKVPGAALDRSPIGLDNGLIDLSANNVCWAMQQVLEPLVTPAIPLNQVQELTARYYGFESWNHFAGTVKNRANDLSFPFELTFLTGCYDDPYPSNPIKYYKGIRAGVAAFGELLASQQVKTFTIDTHFYTYNLPAIDLYYSLDSENKGKLNKDNKGFRINRCSIRFCEEYFSDLAAHLLSQNDPEMILQEYLLTELPKIYDASLTKHGYWNSDIESLNLEKQINKAF